MYPGLFGKKKQGFAADQITSRLILLGLHRFNASTKKFS
jgi:hypothetical protein